VNTRLWPAKLAQPGLVRHGGLVYSRG